MALLGANSDTGTIVQAIANRNQVRALVNSLPPREPSPSEKKSELKESARKVEKSREEQKTREDVNSATPQTRSESLRGRSLSKAG